MIKTATIGNSRIRLVADAERAVITVWTGKARRSFPVFPQDAEEHYTDLCRRARRKETK